MGEVTIGSALNFYRIVGGHTQCRASRFLGPTARTQVSSALSGPRSEVSAKTRAATLNPIIRGIVRAIFRAKGSVVMAIEHDGPL